MMKEYDNMGMGFCDHLALWSIFEDTQKSEVIMFDTKIRIKGSEDT